MNLHFCENVTTFNFPKLFYNKKMKKESKKMNKDIIKIASNMSKIFWAIIKKIFNRC